MFSSSNFRFFLNSILKTIAMATMILFLSHCGGGATTIPQGENGLSKALLKLLGTKGGTIQAEVKAYSQEANLVATQELEVNQDTGKVYSKEGSLMKIPSGATYTFVVTFFYEGNGLVRFPVGVVVKQQTIADSSAVVKWTEADVLISDLQVSGLSVDLTQGLPSGAILGLDADEDGYNNYAELFEDSDPKNKDSIPVPPQLEGTVATDGYVDIVNIDVIFKDASGVAKIIPTDPKCGYHDWKTTPVTEGDLTQVRLQATFNLHATEVQDNIVLSIEATDIWGVPQTYNFPINFTRTDKPPYPQPEIYVVRPSQGETVSDIIDVEAIACHENGIFSLNPVIGQVGIDADTKPEFFLGKIDTNLLGDGPRQLNFVAYAKDKNDPNVKGLTKTAGVTVNVVNDNVIKIDTPPPGSYLTAKSALFIARVDTQKMPDVSELYIESITSDKVPPGENDPELEGLRLGVDENAEPEGFKKNFDLSFEPNEREITIKYVAIGSSTTVTREVKYRIKHNPFVNFTIENDDGQGSCIEGGSYYLSWEISNRASGDPINLQKKINEQFSGDGSLLQSTDAQGKGKISKTCASNIQGYKLEATNLSFSPASKSSAEVKMTYIDIQGLDNEPSKPRTFSVDLVGAVPTTRWRALLKIDDQPKPAQQGIGPVAELKNLEPRSNYTVSFQILNSSGGILSESAPYAFTTLDDELVSWRRFDNSNIPLQDLVGINSNGNFMNQMQIQYPAEGILGDGIRFLGALDSYLSVPDHDSLSPESITLEAWVTWEALNQGIIFSKSNEYELKISGTDLVFTVYDQDNVQHSIIINAGVNFTINPPTWYHLAAVYDLPNKKMFLYVNGVDKKVGALMQNDKAIANTGNILRIGSLLKGSVDELAIYSRALTKSDIIDNCNRVSPGYCQ